jgi:ClpP class serine protease
VWTGLRAKELKLIDAVGTFDDALAKAKEFAGLPAGADIKIEELPEQPGFLESLLAGRVTAAFSPSPARAVAPVLRMVRSMLLGYSRFRAAYCPVVPVM